MKYVAFGDLHFGWNKTITPEGKMKVVPVHEVAAFRAMLAFIHDYKPDKILLMGDMFDMRPVCRHEIDLPKKMEGQRLVEVYEKGWEFFLNPLLKTNAELHWFDGNHEAWAYKLADKYPGVDGIIDPYNFLLHNYSGVKFHPQGDIYTLGKLAFAHGDTLSNSAATAARRAVERYGSSIRIWHWHTYQVWTRETLKNMAYQTGVAVPCLCNRAPSYEATHLNSWVHGFNFGEIEKDGSFRDYIAIIWRGKVSINGKLYDGR